jgi:hypothetical protein
MTYSLVQIRMALLVLKQQALLSMLTYFLEEQIYSYKNMGLFCN